MTVRTRLQTKISLLVMFPRSFQVKMCAAWLEADLFAHHIKSLSQMGLKLGSLTILKRPYVELKSLYFWMDVSLCFIYSNPKNPRNANSLWFSVGLIDWLIGWALCPEANILCLSRRKIINLIVVVFLIICFVSFNDFTYCAYPVNLIIFFLLGRFWAWYKIQ